MTLSPRRGSRTTGRRARPYRRLSECWFKHASGANLPVWRLNLRIGLLLTALLLGLSLSVAAPLAAAQPSADQTSSQSLDQRYRNAAARDDGLRAYAFFWSEGFPAVGRRLLVVVDASGAVEIGGSVAQPIHLSAQDLASFEAAIAAAGFPALPGAPPEVICSDGPLFPRVFEAALNGRRAQTSSNTCGQFDAAIDVGFRTLRELVDAHGGLQPTERLLDSSPVPIWAITDFSNVQRKHRHGRN